jgi:hypothetical protein
MDSFDDEPTLAEQMVGGLGLDPGFTEEHTGLAGALSDDIDATTKRAQKAVDKRRKEAADAERAERLTDET